MEFTLMLSCPCYFVFFVFCSQEDKPYCIDIKQPLPAIDFYLIRKINQLMISEMVTWIK